AAAAATARTVIERPLSSRPGSVGMAAPVAHPGRTPAALVVMMPPGDANGRRPLALLDHVANSLSHWQLMHTLDRLNWEASASSAAVELVNEVLASGSMREAYLAAANSLKTLFACERVVIAAYHETLGKNEIRAISEMAQFDSKAETVEAMAAAMDEAVVRAEITVWPPLTPQQRHATLAHRRLAEVGREDAIVTTPLVHEQKTVGAVMFVGRRNTLHAKRRLNGIRAIAPHLATAIVTRQRAQPSLLSQLLQEVVGRQGSERRRHLWFLAVIVACVLPLVPWRHHVKTDSVLEPVVRRYSVTPFEGILQKGLVEPGDLVAEGDVLARMDDRELRWRISSLSADLARASKEHDAAMAKYDTSEKQIAALKMESVKSELKLYQQRERHLEIISPIAGVVLKGNLQDVEGSPVKTGQSLYEIAPLSPVKVELAIPEVDLPHVQPGMVVDVRLDGLAGGALRGQLARIHPRSEIRDGENIFLAEFEVDNQAGQLRPGMQGRARIRAKVRPLAWIWFHKAWHRLRLLIGY
ncbi:MAG: efflux RND transporter periplasmic adaptor subunit, partial [Pseudomonadota bacterium]